MVFGSNPEITFQALLFQALLARNKAGNIFHGTGRVKFSPALSACSGIYLIHLLYCCVQCGEIGIFVATLSLYLSLYLSTLPAETERQRKSGLASFLSTELPITASS